MPAQVVSRFQSNTTTPEKHERGLRDEVSSERTEDQ